MIARGAKMRSGEFHSNEGSPDLRIDCPLRGGSHRHSVRSPSLLIARYDRLSARPIYAWTVDASVSIFLLSGCWFGQDRVNRICTGVKIVDQPLVHLFTVEGILATLVGTFARKGVRFSNLER